jgi:hypothetical protein
MLYLGMLVVAGHQFPVTSLALRDGKLFIYAEAPGPCPALHDEPVTVFCEDGVGMVQGGFFSIGAVGPDETARVFVSLTWDKTTDEGRS